MDLIKEEEAACVIAHLAKQSVPPDTNLVYAGLIFVFFMAALTLIALKNTRATNDFESQKLRFAAVTFTGILTLFVFAAVLYIAGGFESPGSVIFDRGLTAMFTLAGTVVGYLFGSAAKAAAPTEGPSTPP